LQGISLLRPLKAGKGVEQAYKMIRKHIKKLEDDRNVSEDIKKMMAIIYDENFIKQIEKISGNIE
jgi:histidine ammonia-lyase